MQNLIDNYGYWKSYPDKKFLPVCSTGEADLKFLAKAVKAPQKYVFMTQRTYSQVVVSPIVKHLEGFLVAGVPMAVMFALMIATEPSSIAGTAAPFVYLSLVGITIFVATKVRWGQRFHDQAFQAVKKRLKQLSNPESQRRKIEVALAPYFDGIDIQSFFLGL